MKHSKHFRKDVVIARVVFSLLCIGIITLFVNGVTILFQIGKSSETGNTVSEPAIKNTQLNGESNTQIETESKEEYLITTANVNLRKEPNKNCEIIITIKKTTQLLLLEEQKEWYKVRYQGKEGYISVDYAEKESPQVKTEEETENDFNRSNYLIMLDPDGEQLHFDIGVLLKQELERRGYAVQITRSSEKADSSVQQRADIAAQAGADITIGIHTRSVEDTSVNGASAAAPSSINASVGKFAEGSQKLSHEILNAYCTQTGMENKGIMITDRNEEINAASMPITVLFLGYTSNPSDNSNMQDSGYQKKMVQAIADGIDAYFAQQ